MVRMGRMALESPVSVALAEWEPPSVAELQALLPEYDRVEFIARGGMGAVYRAYQPSLARTVAVKLLPALLREADTGYAQRFRQEARTLASLSHPGIIGIHEAGELKDGSMYFAMEHVQGSDLGKTLAAQGRLDAETVLRLGIEICAALQAAHERGIIHRDIKPANLMLPQAGHVKIADFGLARTPQSGELELTRTNWVPGTPFFTAPELLRGSAPSVRSDLYALGITLYQLLTGSIPQGAFPLPSDSVPGLDRRWDAVLLQALQSDPALRQADALELQRQLEALMKPAQAPAESPPQKKKHSIAPWLLAATVTLCALVWWGSGREASDRSSKPATEVTPKPQAPPGTLPRVTNLLPRFNVKTGAMQGNWRHTSAGILAEERRRGVVILSTHFPVAEEYDYEIEFTVHQDQVQTFVNQVFEVGGRPVEWSLNVSPLSLTPYHSFLWLDGKGPMETPEVRSAQPADLIVARRYHSRVLVRKGSLQAWLDGVRIVSWQGDAARFTAPKHFQWPAGHIGFLAWNGGVTFHKMSLTEHLPSRSHLDIRSSVGNPAEANYTPANTSPQQIHTPPAAAASIPLDLSLEDDEVGEISVLWTLYGQDTPISNFPPGKASLDLGIRTNGRHYLKFRREGYALQQFTLDLANGIPREPLPPIRLIRSRYAIIRVTHATSGQPKLTGPGLKQVRLALTHMAAPENLGSYDWSVVQAGETNPRKERGGPQVWLHFHHPYKGFGFVPARPGESYDTMLEAPAEGYSATEIRPTPGLCLYYRNFGNGTTDQGYGKIEIETITETPPPGITLIMPMTR